ncbi:hypothetical protein ScalyP_jg9205 [Parmales sp. scaly parma]|nr:hypothetical protein ScalyP_jg9205 [Parmales sp. scaly parma]
MRHLLRPVNRLCQYQLRRLTTHTHTHTHTHRAPLIQGPPPPPPRATWKRLVNPIMWFTVSTTTFYFYMFGDGGENYEFWRRMDSGEEVGTMFGENATADGEPKSQSQDP